MSKIKRLVADAGLRFNFEITVILTIDAILVVSGVITYIFTHSLLLTAPFIFLIIALDLADLWRFYYYRDLRQDNAIHEVSLLFRYLYVDLNNGLNVKEALEQLKSYASLHLNELLVNLLESQANDVTPYLAFAHQFPSILLEEVMVALYRYAKKPELENLKIFNEAYLKLKTSSEQKAQERIKTRFDFAKSTAIVGVSIVLIMVIIAIILLVGEYLHG
ncbi:MAG: hypothetical protein MJ206_03705 [Bacilli bacterium]|nr:hypothetical protein [Bacilli bacterium]